MDKLKTKNAEEQIYTFRKSVKYDIRELTIEIIVNKYEKGIQYFDDDEEQEKSSFYNVLYIPEYQRDFTWDEVRQSRFIESVLLGLPIPLIFVAENKDSAWEIVDGSQRIRTLHSFLNNNLELRGLDKLQLLNGFIFDNLEKSRQGKLLDTPIRMIVLSEDADDEVKRDMFERINRGSDLLKPMEKRKGIYIGFFRDFIYNTCAKEPLLSELAPIDKWLEKRQEREELVLRYLALSDNNNYLHFPRDKGIASVLDSYLEKKNQDLDKVSVQQFGKEYKAMTDEEQKIAYQYLLDNNLRLYKERFVNMLRFVKKYSEYGFRKTHNPQTKRVIFESLSVGVHAALLQKPELTSSKQKISSILNSRELTQLWAGNTKVHDPIKVKSRIEFVANNLLK